MTSSYDWSWVLSSTHDNHEIISPSTTHLQSVLDNVLCIGVVGVNHNDILTLFPYFNRQSITLSSLNTRRKSQSSSSSSSSSQEQQEPSITSGKENYDDIHVYGCYDMIEKCVFLHTTYDILENNAVYNAAVLFLFNVCHHVILMQPSPHVSLSTIRLLRSVYRGKRLLSPSSIAIALPSVSVCVTALCDARGVCAPPVERLAQQVRTLLRYSDVGCPHGKQTVGTTLAFTYDDENDDDVVLWCCPRLMNSRDMLFQSLLAIDAAMDNGSSVVNQWRVSLDSLMKRVRSRVDCVSGKSWFEKACNVHAAVQAMLTSDDEFVEQLSALARFSNVICNASFSKARRRYFEGVGRQSLYTEETHESHLSAAMSDFHTSSFGVVDQSMAQTLENELTKHWLDHRQCAHCALMGALCVLPFGHETPHRAGKKFTYSCACGSLCEVTHDDQFDANAAVVSSINCTRSASRSAASRVFSKDVYPCLCGKATASWVIHDDETFDDGDIRIMNFVSGRWNRVPIHVMLSIPLILNSDDIAPLDVGYERGEQGFDDCRAVRQRDWTFHMVSVARVPTVSMHETTRIDNNIAPFQYAFEYECEAHHRSTHKVVSVGVSEPTQNGSCTLTWEPLPMHRVCQACAADGSTNRSWFRRMWIQVPVSSEKPVYFSCMMQIWSSESNSVISWMPCMVCVPSVPKHRCAVVAPLLLHDHHGDVQLVSADALSCCSVKAFGVLSPLLDDDDDEHD